MGLRIIGLWISYGKDLLDDVNVIREVILKGLQKLEDWDSF